MNLFRDFRFWLVGGFAVVVTYQGCGQSFQPTSASSTTQANLSGQSTTPTSTTPPTQPVVEAFKAGDAFQASLLPCTPQAGLAKGLASYGAQTGLRAIAISLTNCMGFISSFYDIATQAEADRMALQACQIASGNMPCVVVAEGATFKYNASDLASNTSTPVPLGVGGTALNLANVPFVTDRMRTYMQSFYVNVTTAQFTYKSSAIYPNGAVGMGFSNVSQALADQNALEECQGFARMQPCMLYSRNALVVYGQTSLTWAPPASTINLTLTTFNASKVPFVSDATRTSFASTNLSASVVYISPLGGYGYAATDATAKQNCNSGDGSITYMDPCVLYSTNGAVSLTAAQIVALPEAPLSPL